MADQNDNLTLRMRIRGALMAARGIDEVTGSQRRLNREILNGSRGAVRASTSFGIMGAHVRLLGGAAIVGAAALGLKFNASMEQNTVAFRRFLGSTDNARKHLQFLFNLAAKTPFEFPELVSASRKLLAFGMTAKESNQWLMTIGDTVSGIGGGAAEIDRVTRAIGQIQSKGKVYSEELQQLAEVGVPAYAAIAKGMGISTSTLFKRLQAGLVDAKTALPLLRAQLDKTFGGASLEQGRTFTGQLSTLKDNTTQLLGKAFRPLFDYLRNKGFPAANRFVLEMQQGIGAGGRFKDRIVAFGHAVYDWFIKPLASAVGWIAKSHDRTTAFLIFIGVLTGAMFLLAIATWAATAPISIWIIGIAAVAAGLYYLYQRSGLVHTIFNAIGSFAKDIALGFVAAGAAIVKLPGQLKHGWTSAVNFVIGKINTMIDGINVLIDGANAINGILGTSKVGHIGHIGMTGGHKGGGGGGGATPSTRGTYAPFGYPLPRPRAAAGPNVIPGNLALPEIVVPVTLIQDGKPTAKAVARQATKKKSTH